MRETIDIFHKWNNTMFQKCISYSATEWNVRNIIDKISSWKSQNGTKNEGLFLRSLTRQLVLNVRRMMITRIEVELHYTYLYRINTSRIDTSCGKLYLCCLWSNYSDHGHEILKRVNLNYLGLCRLGCKELFMLVLMLNCETTKKYRPKELHNQETTTIYIKFSECQFDDAQDSSDLRAQTYGSNRNHRPTRVLWDEQGAFYTNKTTIDSRTNNLKKAG